MAFSISALSLLSRRPLLAALLLALAVDAKPWAVPFVVVLAVVDRAGLRPHWGLGRCHRAGLVTLPLGRSRYRAGALALHHRELTSSALRFLGVDDPRTPTWVRSAQLVGGLAIGCAVPRRRGPAAALLAVVAVRLLFDPGTNTYYGAGLLTVCLAYDLAGRRGRLPVATLLAFTMVCLPRQLYGWHAFDTTAGALRALFLLGVLFHLLTCSAARRTRRWYAQAARA